jgi:hypothetical protein
MRKARLAVKPGFCKTILVNLLFLVRGLQLLLPLASDAAAFGCDFCRSGLQLLPARTSAFQPLFQCIELVIEFFRHLLAV